MALPNTLLVCFVAPGAALAMLGLAELPMPLVCLSLRVSCFSLCIGASVVFWVLSVFSTFYIPLPVYCQEVYSLHPSFCFFSSFSFALSSFLSASPSWGCLFLPMFSSLVVLLVHFVRVFFCIFFLDRVGHLRGGVLGSEFYKFLPHPVNAGDYQALCK